MATINEQQLIKWCRAALAELIRRNPESEGRLSDLQLLLSVPPGPLADRRTMPGHLTASGIVVDPHDHRVLLLHHRALDRWLQPGGHLETGELPVDAARREVLEETGIAVGPVASPLAEKILPVDIDSHEIPANARKNETAHTHHDFRFAFFLRSEAHPIIPAADEVVDAAWMSMNDSRFPQDLRLCVEHVLKARLYESQS